MNKARDVSDCKVAVRYWLQHDSCRHVGLTVLTLLMALAAVPQAGSAEQVGADLVLPMPGGGEIAFRRVDVPGGNFWADEARIVQIGDAEGGIFEGVQRVQVSGSFRDVGGWHYFLGKHEVTKGQVASVLGLKQLAAASGWSQDRRLPALSGQDLSTALRYPAIALDWLTVQTFIDRYNRWLFAPEHPERRAALPHNAGVPGFVRLPTEIEWEFAARGGAPALRDGTFTDRLPFDPEQARRYSWHLDNAKRRLRPVGLREPTVLGFHDLFGNARELVADRFRPEIWQGQPGALTARGGSVYDPASRLRSSMRSEVEVYQWDRDSRRMEPMKSPTTGLRLALGSNVLYTSGVKRELEAQYRRYVQTIRARTPVGRTLNNPVAEAAGSLGGADATIDGMIQTNPGLERKLRELQARIRTAEAQLDRGLKAAAAATGRDALRTATSLGRDVFKLHSLESRARAQVEALADSSTRYQRLLADIERQIAQRRDNIKILATRHAELVKRLGEAGDDYVDRALGELAKGQLTPAAQSALELVREHTRAYRGTRRIDTAAWLDDFRRRFEHKDS